MGKRTREIIALVLLALLGLVVLAAMAWYIFVGHNWNIAASHIDESVGQMDGYTVILYEGLTLPKSELERISDGQPMLDDSNRGGIQRPSGEYEEQEQPVSMNEAASYYRAKGATVFMLKSGEPATYDVPIVLNKNGFWMGVYYADGATSRLEAQFRTANLKTRGVDFVVMMVDDARLIENYVSSADIVICTSDEELSSRGEYFGSCFCVDSPLIGQVQTIIISPSRVLTSKTITWL